MLGRRFEALSGALVLVPFTSAGEVTCDEDLVGDPEIGASRARPDGTVFLDEPLAHRRYDEMGDFAIGYMLGTAWSEAAQESFGSPLSGEDRALINDCLTGSVGQDAGPRRPGQHPARRRPHRAWRPGRGDPDALVAGDPATDDDVVGSVFEKIASFRTGVLGGVDACEELLQD